MAFENPTWGTQRIRGELLKLGITVSARSIRRYRIRTSTRPPSQTWRTFLSNQAKGIWASDLLVVQTIGFRTLYILFLVSHVRRELMYLNVTASPTAAWVWQQLVNATPWGRKPVHLIHDRDNVYGKDFDARLAALGAPKLAEAENSRKKAEGQLQVVTANQQASLNERLLEQRGVMEKTKTDAVNAEKSKNFDERLKLEEKLQQMQRQLQNKTADELGEGAELDLLEVLKEEFPEDDVRRVGKGKEGADIIHTVKDGGRECGRIVYDSKNRSAWRNDYVSKLRADQLAAKADSAILATHVLPAGARQMHVQDGVIVLNPARTVVVVEVLRNHIVQMHTLRLSSVARTDKTAKLYDFIASDRWAQLVDQIEAETDHMLELDVKEVKAHEATWKRRGQLIRSVQRARGELTSEVDRIIGGPAVIRAVEET